MPKVRAAKSSLDRCCFPSPTSAQRLEGFSGLDQNRWIARRRLAASYDHVDIERVEFDPATDAASGLGGDEDRAGAKEWVDDKIAAIAEVEERVLIAVGLTVG